MPSSPDWVSYFFPIFLFLVWISALLSNSGKSGWQVAARIYPVPAGFEGTNFPHCFVRLGGVHLNGMVHLEVNESGLCLSVSPAFRPGHPPFFVPWRDVEASIGKGFLSSGVVFRFRKASSATLEVSSELAADMAVASRGRFEVPKEEY